MSQGERKAYNQAVALMLCLEAGGILQRWQIAQELEGGDGAAWYVLRSLRRRGLLEQPRHGYYWLTERGRIACALLMVKRPDLRHSFLV